jgi:hypothetical protein
MEIFTVWAALLPWEWGRALETWANATVKIRSMVKVTSTSPELTLAE